MRKRYLENGGDPDEDRIYKSNAEIDPYVVTAKRTKRAKRINDYTSKLNDYQLAQLKRYYTNPDGSYTDAGMRYMQDMATHNTTGRSQYMKDVNTLSKAAIGAVAMSAPMILATQPGVGLGGVMKQPAVRAVRKIVTNPVVELGAGAVSAVSAPFEIKEAIDNFREGKVLQGAGRLGLLGLGAVGGFNGLKAGYNLRKKDMLKAINEGVDKTMANHMYRRQLNRGAHAWYHDPDIPITMPDVVLSLNPLKYTNYPKKPKQIGKALNLLNTTDGIYRNGPQTIHINPKLFFTGRSRYLRSLGGHETQHHVQQFFNKHGKLSIPNPNGEYNIRNPDNYNLIKYGRAFDRNKGKWEGSPAELDSEMIAWKLYRDIPLNVDYKYLSKDQQDYIINRAIQRFSLTEKETTDILNMLSNMGYF